MGPNEPLQVVVEAPDRITLKLVGNLKAERVPTLLANVAEAKKKIEETSARAGKKIGILLDMSEFDGTYEVDAMKAMIDLAQNDTKFVERTASFGGPFTAAMAGEVVATLAGRQNIQFFKTKEQALAWLAAPATPSASQ